MRRRTAAACLALLLAAGPLAACAAYTTTGLPADEPTPGGTSLAPGADALDGSSWDLTSSTAAGIDLTQLTITATFADGNLSGRAPVNSYSATYRIADATADAGSLTLGPIATTKKAGTDDLMAAETAYLSLLASVTGFRRDGEHLSLLAGGTPALEYQQKDETARALAATAAFAQTLVGRTTEAAGTAAAQGGYTFRVISEDGVDKAATTDLVTDRINATVVEGVVTSVTAG